MPPQYTRVGTAYECLRKGVGVGKYMQLQKPPRLLISMSITVLLMVLNVFLTILIIVVVATGRRTASNVEKDGEDTKN